MNRLVIVTIIKRRKMMDEKSRIKEIACYLESNKDCIARASKISPDSISIGVDKFRDLVRLSNCTPGAACSVGIKSEIYLGAKVYVNGSSEGDPLRKAVVDCLRKSHAYFLY